MKKNLRKNKKGFTLVEIIVVLLIIGILLAITIPSIMGYVNKAKEAKYEAQARSGFLAAQTITAANVAKGETNDANLAAAITKANVATELNETAGNETISEINCTVSNKNLEKCSIKVKDFADKWVNFEANKEAVVATTPTVPAPTPAP
ncbi:prepilin-type N-terminal cleavage/methylation domain-containing protein [[Eubacterium] hominis]|uniref:prepilin-type N-terminal cleavage/methylation domain-containing protein n=1 Tax=[Eubacterium] hominis TaxID=2764325 RepID=UPI003A4DB68D